MIVAKKNAAYYLSFPAIDSTTPASYKSGVSPVDTAYYKDGAGAWTSLAITDAASEIGSTGVYEIDLTASEMNHDKVIIKFAVSGMADDAYQFDMSAKLTDDLQDITTAQVNTECDTALTDYDPPTNTEMIARTLAAASYFDPAADAVANVTLVATTTTNTDMLAATDIVSNGAITTLTGAVVNVDLVDTLTTYTGNTLQTGDVTTAIDDLANPTDGLGAIKAETATILIDTGTTIPGTITTLQADTDDIQTRLPAALVSGKMDSDATAISGSTAAADQLEASAETIVVGAAATGTLSTTQMSTNLTEVTDDHYNGRILIWTSGVLKDQATNITDYVGTNGVLTFTATTEAPSNSDTFVIV